MAAIVADRVEARRRDRPPETLGKAGLGVVVEQEDRRPSAASVPARWCVVLVLPTPPFWFNSVITGIEGSLRDRGNAPCIVIDSSGLSASVGRPRCTVHQGDRMTGAGSRDAPLMHGSSVGPVGRRCTVHQQDRMGGAGCRDAPLMHGSSAGSDQRRGAPRMHRQCTVHRRDRMDGAGPLMHRALPGPDGWRRLLGCSDNAPCIGTISRPGAGRSARPRAGQGRGLIGGAGGPSGSCRTRPPR